MKTKNLLILIITFYSVNIIAQNSSRIKANNSKEIEQYHSNSLVLKVENDRNTRSTPSDGTYYKMIISNNGNSADVFSLTSKITNENCSNTEVNNYVKKVNLDALFLDKNLKPIREIRVNPKESISFFVHITVPKGTAVNAWCCTQVTANSRSNPNYKAETILHTLVINPSEDN